MSLRDKPPSLLDMTLAATSGGASPSVARPSVTVIVCVYTARRLWALKAALTAVREQMCAGDELVVVIDHNRGLFQLASRLAAANVDAAPRVRVLHNQYAPGLSGARNTGIAAAQGDLVVFLDDDAVPRAGWLARLTEPFGDPDVIGVGGHAAPAWELDPPDWLPEEFLWVVGCSYKGLPERPAEIRNPIGATMAFRRRVIEQVGRFTEGLGRIGGVPLGCEETELSIRAMRMTGGRILQQPAAAVDHVVPAERLRFTYFMRRCWAEGISKAAVSRLAGADAALASERRYTTRTLSAGVRAGIREGLAGDSSGFRRAASIVLGLAVATGGYVRGLASQTRSGVAPRLMEPHTGSGFQPIWRGELEMQEPALPSRIVDPNGIPYERGRILVRAGGAPLGFIELETAAGYLNLALAIERSRAAFGERAESAVTETKWTAERDELVSVVLCTRNRTVSARRAIESLQALRHPNVDIIVVDSAPDDDSTRRVVAELSEADPRVRYVCERVKGLSRARNRGVHEAAGEFVAFTDDDVQVDPLWINGFLRGFDKGPDVACVTGMVASGSLNHPAEQYFDRRFGWSAKCEPRVFTRTRTAADSPLHPYMAGAFGTGANFAARASVLRTLGGFDECLGAGSPTHGGEDLDMFVRIITSGHAISYEPSALVWHGHRVDDESLRSQMYAYGLGLTAFLTKHLLAPGSRVAFARRIPAGLAHMLTLMRRSRRAAAQASFDRGRLTYTEARGMLAGPFVYLQARRHIVRSEFNA